MDYVISLTSVSCWATLIVTLLGLAAAVYFTNRDAFPYRGDQDQLEGQNPVRGPFNE